MEKRDGVNMVGKELCEAHHCVNECVPILLNSCYTKGL